MKDSYHHGNLKNDLIENAITVISAHGLDAVSIRELAAKCGVSHNAVYRHFENKEMLIDCCREYVTNELTNFLKSTLVSDSWNWREDTITKLGQNYVLFYQQHPTYYSAMYRNTTYNLIITLQKKENNYPPFELFREICVKLVAHGKMKEDECLIRLSRYWALIHGVLALIISQKVEVPNGWLDKLKISF